MLVRVKFANMTSERLVNMISVSGYLDKLISHANQSEGLVEKHSAAGKCHGADATGGVSYCAISPRHPAEGVVIFNLRPRPVC